MSQERKIACHTEYDVLKQVIVSPPTYMEIRDVINETQEVYKEENIDVDIAQKQHDVFVKTMREHGVDVIEIESDPDLNEQVFTRDVGFTIGGQVRIGKMASNLRVKEISYFKQLLEEHNIPYQDELIDSIEGGDVIIDKDIIWVGISLRTTKHAVEKLQELLPEYKVVSLPLAEGILHLDCTFNVVAQDLALAYPGGLSETDMKKIHSQYKVIEVDDEEQFTLGTNVLSLGHKKLLSLPENKRVNKELRDRGFEVIEVAFNEIIKSGGSFRCCSMPVVREQQKDSAHLGKS